jgi:hypothetical protein
VYGRGIKEEVRVANSIMTIPSTFCTSMYNNFMDHPEMIVVLVF